MRKSVKKFLAYTSRPAFYALSLNLFILFVLFSCTNDRDSDRRKNRIRLLGSSSSVKESAHKGDMDSLDKNGDGVLSVNEFKDTEKFLLLDIDGNQIITQDELRRMQIVHADKSPKKIKKDAPLPAVITETKIAKKTLQEVSTGINMTAKAFKKGSAPLKKLGVKIVRIPILWKWIEPMDGIFDWQQVEPLLEEAEKNGIEVLFLIKTISNWGTGGSTKQSLPYNTASMPNDITKWKRFLMVLANRYKSKSVYFEIEYKVSSPAFWSGSVDEYKNLISASYSAIKEVAPHAKILHSSVPCGTIPSFIGEDPYAFEKSHDLWLREILSARHYDIININNYYFPSDITINGFTFSDYIKYIQAILKELKIDDKPLWITESGFFSEDTDIGVKKYMSTPSRQAKWMEEAYKQASELGVKRIFWYLLKDNTEDFYGSMGLIDIEGKKRPAWKLVKKML